MRVENKVSKIHLSGIAVRKLVRQFCLIANGTHMPYEITAQVTFPPLTQLKSWYSIATQEGCKAELTTCRIYSYIFFHSIQWILCSLYM